MKLIIAGSREFFDYPLLKKEVSIFLNELQDLFPDIISGRCEGADTLGEWYAKERGLRIIPMPADWTKYGRAAGPIRNREMAKVADACIVFWNGETDGSASMVRYAREFEITLKEIKI